ncbi:MAG: hypothetical protein BGO49_05575 [Planctomycetales bacterium 71-10]|nr:MAG: hypothetical protein BGO49_05575 [Planctomycetales bacterium 71-10]
MDTLSIRSLVCNAAAVFSESYGAATRRAEEAGCSRQTVYEHARRVERRLQPPAPEPESAATAAPAVAATFDEATRRRFAATACAMGISLRQVEDLLRVVLGDDGPDHSTIGRWVKEESARAAAVLEALDAGCVERISTLALDEIFFGGGRPWWGSSP